MGLTELVHLLHSSTKSTIVYIAATANSTSGRHFCALFKYVLHYPQGNERTGHVRSFWVDVTRSAGPILLRLGRVTKMAVFGNYNAAY